MKFSSIGPAWCFLALLLYAAYGQAQECTQAELSAEFSTDPTARGYATCTDDPCYLDKLNEPCIGNANCNKVENVLTREQIYQTIIDATELDTLANGTAPADVKHQKELGWLLNATTWNMALNSSQKHWKNPFPSSTSPITNAAIDAAKLRDASRCQAVCSKSACTLSEVSCGLRGDDCQ
jgi:hypothetical protein